jgi:hypothetical protein
VKDALFATVAELVPGIGDNEEDEEFDLAAMMATQRAQSAMLHQEALKLRATAPSCGPSFSRVVTTQWHLACIVASSTS